MDKVAASGGYMMACVANKILCAPFSFIGSIGVVAQLPNFNRLLKKHDVDIELHTAGSHKRTLTMFGENTQKDRDKFIDDLDNTHRLFKNFVSEHRPNVDINSIATGEVWLGTEAITKGLVDELLTSDEYLLYKTTDTDIYEVVYAILLDSGLKKFTFLNIDLASFFTSINSSPINSFETNTPLSLSKFFEKFMISANS